MAVLTQFLQSEFSLKKPQGWSCQSEAAVLPKNLCRILGFTPRADVLLQKDDGTRRYWIEFEVSRADPAANHVKFAATHLFNPQPLKDIFVSMVSAHVAQGRRNLGATAVSLMRRVGMDAFQTTLFPQFSAREIKHFNHMPSGALREAELDVCPEMSRVFQVAEPLSSFNGARVHFAGNVLEVLLNIRTWNLEMKTIPAKKMWGKRTVTYFVYDDKSGRFAPSKFCAYTFIRTSDTSNSGVASLLDFAGMSIERYVSVNRSEWRFDGQRAKEHLVRNLGLALTDSHCNPELLVPFRDWLNEFGQVINVSSSGPRFIVPKQLKRSQVRALI